MRSSEAGYTILEALVAFAILSVVLVSLYAAALTSVRSVDRGARAHQIAMLAYSKLDELAANSAPLPHVAFGAFFGTDVSWRADANDVPGKYAGPPRVRLQDVDLMLMWPEGVGGHGRMELRTRHLGTVRR